MLEPHETKTSRLEARLPLATHELLKQAAALQGRSVSEFVVQSAREAAEQAITEHELIRLSAADQRRFVEELLAPRPLSPAMKRAEQRHSELIGPA